MLDKQEYNEPVMTGLIKGTDERDLLMSEIEIDWNKVPKRLPKPRTELNQWANVLTLSSCTMAGAEIQVCQLYDKLADNEKLKEICKKAIKDDKRDPANWRYFSDGNNTVRKYFLEKYNYDTCFIRVDIDSPDFQERKKRGWLIWMWYRRCPYYSIDYREDSVVEGKGDKRKTLTWWHRTNFLEDWVLDSYFWRKNNKWEDCNFYKVLHPKELVKNRIYFNEMYIFVKKERIKTDTNKLLEEKKEKIQINAFVNQGSLIWKYVKNPNLRENLELLVQKFRKEYSLEREYTEEEKEKQVLLALLQKIKDKEINNQQIIETIKKIVK